MNVIRNLFCSYQTTPQNDYPLETVISVSGTSGHDDRSNPFNEAPILAACRSGNLSWARELLERDPYLASQTAMSGKTGQKVHPLLVAVQEGHIDIVKRLTVAYIETLKALPEADRSTAIRAMLMAPCTNGATPVYIAVQNGHIDIVKYLIAVFIESLQTLPEADRATPIRAMVTAAGKEGQTSVYIAAQQGHIDLVKYLISVFIETLKTLPEANRDTSIRTMITSPCTNGITPFYIAAQNGHINVMKHLIAVCIETLKTMPEEADRDTAIRTMVTAPCEDGATSVFIAAQNGHGEVVNWLLEHGADPEKRWVMCFLGKYRVFRPYFTITPLEAAIQNKHVLIADRLTTAIRERKASFSVAERGRLISSSTITERTPLIV